MKTIADLNQKWWYRLIKVMSLFLTTAICLFAIFVVYDEYSPVFDKKNSYVRCLDGRDFSLEKYPNIYGDYVSTDTGKDFRSWCTTESYVEEGVKKLRKLDSYYSTEPQYTYVPMYTDPNWLRIVSDSLIAILVILSVAEMIRRVFYYIVLGKLRPPRV